MESAFGVEHGYISKWDKVDTAAAAGGLALAGGGVALHNKHTTGKFGGLASKEGLKPTVTTKQMKDARKRYEVMVAEHKASKR